MRRGLLSYEMVVLFPCSVIFPLDHKGLSTDVKLCEEKPAGRQEGEEAKDGHSTCMFPLPYGAFKEVTAVPGTFTFPLGHLVDWGSPFKGSQRQFLAGEAATVQHQ